ncbi:uncharacterized protein NEMAJ01_0874 [Nematocida major]|uniref:uncharacterized protein n=1 Tax=Nematocida major TaxID=1912982 RepID=UPI002007BB0A|nr:uncharacterized protein NEMAJ01_0874 [Nematocida major]KAH9385978.1 hypothetical protein NEMAJ01_0874 [Nematocida major]
MKLRHKRKQIWRIINVCFLLWLQQAPAGAVRCMEMSFDDMLDLHMRMLGSVGGVSVGLNCYWHGSPMCAYISRHLGFMQNARMFLSSMRASFGLSLNGSSNGLDYYKYTRTPCHDTAHLFMATPNVLAESEDSEYASEYCTAMILMFPLGTDERLSIESTQTDSFTGFLRRCCRKDQPLYILAALLLLSEGVDVPIEAAGDKVVLACRKGPNAPLHDIFTIGKGLDAERVSQNVCQVVGFFKKHKNTRSMPNTFFEFQTGGFLECPQFLISTYIYEYIGSTKDMVRFFECVLELLEGLGLLPELPAASSSAESVFSRLFMPSEDLRTKLQHFLPLIETHAHAELLECLGLAAQAQRRQNTPSQPDLPVCGEYGCQRHAGSLEEEPVFCTEKGLRALLLCLAYNPDKMLYDINGFLCKSESSGETERTRKLLSEEQNQMIVCSALTSHLEWTWPKITRWFGKNRHLKESLRGKGSGILDLMCVLVQISGRAAELLPAIQKCKEEIGQALNCAEEAAQKVNACVFEVFSALAVSKNIGVCVYNYVRRGSSEEGTLLIAHQSTDGAHHYKVEIEFNRGHMKVEMSLPVRGFSVHMKRLASVECASYRMHGSFASCVFAEYLSRTAAQRRFSEPPLDLSQKLWDATRAIARSSPNNPNRVLLLHPIQTLMCKKLVVDGLILNSVVYGVPLTRSHPIVRLVSNVIGSASLDKYHLQHAVHYRHDTEPVSHATAIRRPACISF